MARIITHWTAGDHHASDVDREHYHVLVEGDGRLVRGDHPVSDNVSTQGGVYAAHTRGTNTGSIGIAVCCMAGAMQIPFRSGRWPMKQKQHEVMATAVADLCERYQIAVSRSTVLGHGEVQEALQRPQAGKWDPMVLPWDPDRTMTEVGDAFRSRVQDALGTQTIGTHLPPVRIILDGDLVSEEGILKGGTSWAPLAPIASALGWTVVGIDNRLAKVLTPMGEREVTAAIRGDRGFVKVRDLCAALGWAPALWEGPTRTVRIQTA
jgi:hypothetical protein